MNMKTEYPKDGEKFFYLKCGFLDQGRFDDAYKRRMQPNECFNTIEEFKAANPPIYFDGKVYLFEDGISKRPEYLHISLDKAKRAYISAFDERLNYARILEIDVLHGLVAIHTTDFDKNRKPMHIWKRTEV